MSDRAYAWGVEHFCEPDAVKLHSAQPRYLNDYSRPTELDHLPVTFCSVCLGWFSDAHPEGAGTPTPPREDTP